MTFDTALYAPTVFRAAPRGPAGVAGPRLDRKIPSGLPTARVRIAALFAAAVALLMSDS